MKVYIDCRQNPLPLFRERNIHRTVSELLHLEEKWREGQRFSLTFREMLQVRGIKVLDFENQDFSQNGKRISDFVRVADAVVALEGYPFLGFSSEGYSASGIFHKPRFVFIRHSADFSVVKAADPLFVRNLFCTDDFPAKVLHRFIKEDVRAAA